MILLYNLELWKDKEVNESQQVMVPSEEREKDYKNDFLDDYGIQHIMAAIRICMHS